MNAVSLREVVLLAAGIGVLLVGLLSTPRDPATIGIGVSMLVATPAATALTRNSGGPPDAQSTSGQEAKR